MTKSHHSLLDDKQLVHLFYILALKRQELCPLPGLINITALKRASSVSDKFKCRSDLTNSNILSRKCFSSSSTNKYQIFII